MVKTEQSGPINELFHNEEIKKKYTKMERDIKRKLTECVLRDHLGEPDFACSGLSFTKDFGIRELNKDENSKFTINLANIKEDTTTKTRRIFKQEIDDLIERNIEQPDIKEKYMNGIKDFMEKHKNKSIDYLRKNKKYYEFIAQHKNLIKSEKKEEKLEFNILAQVGKIMNEKFGDKAFLEKENGEIELSNICTDYLYVLFCSANKVRTKWGKSLNQVFHDNDHSFIKNNQKKSAKKYLKAIKYLVSREKHNPFGRREEAGNKEWAKKTTQYSDILRALTNNQLHIENIPYLTEEKGAMGDNEIPEFTRDYTTEQLKKIGGGMLNNIVQTHNKYEREGLSPFNFSSRNKSLESCVEKIIEGKKISDTTGLRVSIEDTKVNHFESIKELTLNWLKQLSTSLINFPEKYTKNGETLKIKNITIDNKGVLEENQIEELMNILNTLKICNVKRREKAKSSFIQQDERREKMKKNYNEDFTDTKKWETYSTFFKQFAEGKPRGVNGEYKDFKLNINIGVYNKEGKEIGEKPIEVQFDDINNGVGLANFNIRNIERSVNTQSNLSFNLNLESVRKITESKIKEMVERSEGKEKKFSEIDFGNGFKVDISSFDERTTENDHELNKTIIEIINYFIKKGTFFLYYNPEGTEKNPENEIILDKGLLTISDLDKNRLELIQICSGLEVAKQQYSYLGSKADTYIGIYNAKEEKILREKMGKVIDRINLGKKKDGKHHVV